MAGRARVEDTATSPDSNEAGVADDGVWLQALSELTPVPRQYACPSVASADATTFLGCDAATLAALTDHGLPAYPSGYDQFDLINLALHARLGTSIPEISLGFLLRFITDDPATWTTSMRWKFSAQGSCAPHSDETAARDRTPVAGERWVVWAPEAGHNNTAPQAANGKATVVGPTLAFSCETATAGRAAVIHSAQIRAVVDEIIDAGYTFARMPTAAQRDAAWMRGRRIFDCVSISAELEHRFLARGLQCRTRYGWLAALAASGHAWIEVLDNDDQWKPIDLALRSLAQILYPEHTQFQQFCLGSRLNRLIPTGCPIDQSLITHVCDGVMDDDGYRVSIQQLRD
ncbi:hypothetical protein BN000_00043 [Mycobacterium europaeum]|nr:hypothetical protein BST19_20445 [Mycobacterium bouchedurhonense]CQD01990.1 hypothetical protein BN000_00043 [Mycobacterium europaeum]